MGADERVIADARDLARHFGLGAKPKVAFRVGAEHEKIGVLADGSAVPYQGERGIGKVLERLAVGGYEAVREDGNVIALRRGSMSVTLEPGGQLELSGAVARDAYEAGRELCDHFDEVKQVSEGLGITWLAIGFRPFQTLADVPWMPKGRYRVMKAYLPTRGRLAHEMMKRTATVQANLDYEDEADASRKFRTAMGVTSLVTALYANSPLVDGKPSGYKTYRAAVWLETDPDRCGLLPFAFDSGDALFERYAEWALDVPMFFVYRDSYVPAGGLTFRRFLREGFRGQRATLSDWELHLSTLFPEVRLKRYLEMRGADSGPVELVRALPALWRGLLYDRDACAAAWQLVADLSMDEREQLRRDVPRQALEARVRGRSVRELARELIAIAKAGAKRLLRHEARLLAPLERIVEEGRVPADRVLDAYAAAAGDTAALMAAVRY
ncbi:MAG TPA: glutamate--cysteine ligase [Polyangia bacterium]|nr:glutamate--cysteine ligase [Polyangia bacterium]